MQRVELHAHTKYTKGCVSDFYDMAMTAKSAGLSGIAIADLGTTAGLYDMAHYLQPYDEPRIDTICGVEVYLKDDTQRLEDYFNFVELDIMPPISCCVVLLAKNTIGMRNMNHLLSDSSYGSESAIWDTDRVCLRREEIEKYREGLLVGSSTENGEVVNALLGEYPDESMAEIMAFYDYVEISSISNMQEGIVGTLKHKFNTDEDVKELIKILLKCCEKYDVPLVAVSNAYYAAPKNKIAHKIVAEHFDRHIKEGAYIHTTEELLSEFAFLGEDIAERIVITNSRKIAEQITLADPIRHVSEKPLIWRNSDKEILTRCRKAVHKLYGENLPMEVSTRLAKELNGIIHEGYETLYLTESNLIRKMELRQSQYRFTGTCGNSFVAYLLGISGTVNPLKPHYRCENRDYTEFVISKAEFGCELPDKICPVCGKKLIKDGFSLSELFLMGYRLDKKPSFSLIIMSSKKKEVERTLTHLKGVGQVIACGTEEQYFLNHIIGSKRLSDYKAKHNIVFSEKECHSYMYSMEKCLENYQELLYPDCFLLIPDYAGEAKNYVQIHRGFYNDTLPVPNFHSFSHLFAELFLYDTPLANHLARVEELTGVLVESIPLDDEKVPDVFFLEEGNINGISGISCLMGMMPVKVLTKYPVKKLWDLVKVLGILDGIRIWPGNAENFLTSKVATLNDIIVSRDDVFDALVRAGMEETEAFRYAERIRKGVRFTLEQEDELREHNVPKRYIEFCNTINYLFPRSSLISYAIQIWRLAWYKQHYPEQFYQAYLEGAHITIKNLFLSGRDAVNAAMQEILKNRTDDKSSYFDSEKDGFIMTVYEMYRAGMDIPRMDLSYTFH